MQGEAGYPLSPLLFTASKQNFVQIHLMVRPSNTASQEIRTCFTNISGKVKGRKRMANHVKMSIFIRMVVFISFICMNESNGLSL